MKRLLDEIERVSEYLIQNAQLSAEEVELFYEFCYKLLLKYKECNNVDLIERFLDDDFAKINLAVHGLIYENLHN